MKVSFLVNVLIEYRLTLFRDDHQRVLLHVSVDMHILAGNDHHESNGQPLASKTKLHLYSTHLRFVPYSHYQLVFIRVVIYHPSIIYSLNERARNDSYIAISLKMEKDGGFLQVHRHEMSHFVLSPNDESNLRYVCIY
jgi:hypothetical protein